MIESNIRRSVVYATKVVAGNCTPPHPIPHVYLIINEGGVRRYYIEQTNLARHPPAWIVYRFRNLFVYAVQPTK